MHTFNTDNLIVVWGAGEIASGVIWHLVAHDYQVIALEQQQPHCVRRFVSFANAYYEQRWEFNGVTSVFIHSIDEARIVLQQKQVPLFIDPQGKVLSQVKPSILIDGRMKKRISSDKILFHGNIIGLGPGFCAGDNCVAVIETNRGRNLGSAIYHGRPEEYTGIPSAVDSYTRERVVRSPSDGMFVAKLHIGDMVKKNDIIGRVDTEVVYAKIGGVIRGLIHSEVYVRHNQKIGDIDPRGKRELCYQMSDKAHAVGLGALEVVSILSK